MDFVTNFNFSSSNYLDIGTTEAAIIFSLLGIAGVLIFVKTLFYTETEDHHQPEYMSNKKQKNDVSYQRIFDQLWFCMLMVLRILQLLGHKFHILLFRDS